MDRSMLNLTIRIELVFRVSLQQLKSLITKVSTTPFILWQLWIHRNLNKNILLNEGSSNMPESTVRDLMINLYSSKQVQICSLLFKNDYRVQTPNHYKQLSIITKQGKKKHGILFPRTKCQSLPLWPN